MFTPSASVSYCLACNLLNQYYFARFQEWSRKYGSIFSVSHIATPAVDVELMIVPMTQVKIASGTMIVVSNANSVKQLIDKTGWSASSRPVNYLAGICTDNNHAGLERHGKLIIEYTQKC